MSSLKPNFKIGDFALVQGQIVEILDVRIGTSREFDWFRYKVKLNGGTITNWVNEIDIKQLPQQTTAQVLFRKAQ